jgi:hypothetical protein
VCTDCQGDHLRYACPLGLEPLIVDGSRLASAESDESSEDDEEDNGSQGDVSSQRGYFDSTSFYSQNYPSLLSAGQGMFAR